MTEAEAISLGELQRKIDDLTRKIDLMGIDIVSLKIAFAMQAGKFTGIGTVLLFVGTVAGALATWATARFHL